MSVSSLAADAIEAIHELRHQADGELAAAREEFAQMRITAELFERRCREHAATIDGLRAELRARPSHDPATEKIVTAAVAVMFNERGDARDWPIGEADHDLVHLEELKVAIRDAGRAPSSRKRWFACSVCGDNISPDEGVYGDKCPPCEADPTARSVNNFL